MGMRKVYFCDWCGIDSPCPNAVGEGWDRVAHGDPGEWICDVCSRCRKEAIAMVKRTREALQVSSDPRGPK